MEALSYLVSSILRIVQAFESIVDTLISQDNITEIRVIAEDVDLIAKQVSVRANQPCILLHTFDYSAPCNTADSQKRISGIDLFCYRR